MKVAIYCRLSKDDEVRKKLSAKNESESIQNQKSILIQYAIDRGYDIHDIYVDEDYSGADRDRPAFNRLIEDASQHMLIEANAARVIKAVTNTPLDIPEGAEVIDVCKAVEEMMNESEERGELRMLVKQVRKGRITIEQAAEDANMSVEQFKRVMDDTPLQAV